MGDDSVADGGPSLDETIRTRVARSPGTDHRQVVLAPAVPSLGSWHASPVTRWVVRVGGETAS